MYKCENLTVNLRSYRFERFNVRLIIDVNQAGQCFSEHVIKLKILNSTQDTTTCLRSELFVEQANGVFLAIGTRVNGTWAVAVADLGGPRDQFFLDFMQFFGKVNKIVYRLPQGWRPLRKSWICHWFRVIKKM